MTDPDPTRDDTTGPGELSPLDEAADGSTAPIAGDTAPGRPQPDHIGSYAILGELGRGGMGVVYVAEDPRLERQVALKVLPGEVAGDLDRRARFEHEARLLANMNHPNIATIYSLERDGEVHFLTMELIDGETLARRLERGPLPVDEALTTGRLIARALEAAHQRGIVHRDLKPLNIMVMPDDEVKVLDFGLAKSFDREAAGSPASSPGGMAATPADAIAAGTFVGTPGYMSPEQLRGEEVDPRTDIFAFGCLLYECLSGKPAFGGATLRERIETTLNAEPDLDRLSQDVPDSVRGLIARCLPKTVGGRLAGIAEARRTLEEVTEQRTLERLIGSREPRVTVHPNNLPRQLTSFVGRSQEIVELTECLTENALVTLTGVGGCGKTRLALHVAARRLPDYPDGVWLVKLAPVVDPELVPQTVMAALGLKEAPGKTPGDVVLEHVRGKQLLFLLDSCEHVLAAVTEFAGRLLQAGRNAALLATSREAIGIDGETIYPVATLTMPTEASGSVDAVRASDAVQLFVDRARLVNRSFELTDENAAAVSEICRRLDGIPLALELAAARTRVLSIEDVASRLDQRFKILTGRDRTALPHHQTLRGLIDWSYEQLEAREQAVMRRLSVFAGGWTLEAAEAVCSEESIEGWEVLDLFANLVAKSLVERDAEGSERSGQTRYRMLETLREYARERLREAGERSETRRRHRDHFVALAEEARQHLTGPDQAAWFSRLSADHENFRSALERCADPEADAELGLRLTAALGLYWDVRGRWTEGRAACARALARSGAEQRNPSRGAALSTAGTLAFDQGDYASARAHHEESLSIRRELGEKQGVAGSLNSLGNVALIHGDYILARERYEESLSIRRELNHRQGIADTLSNLGGATFDQGDYESARAHYEESLSIRRELGDQTGIAISLMGLGNVAYAQSDYVAARAHLEESLAMKREVGDRWGIASSLTNLGNVARAEGDHVAARAHFEECLAICRELGNRWGVAFALGCLGDVASARGDHVVARSLHEESLYIRRELGDRTGIAESLEAFGFLAAARDGAVKSARLYGAADALRESIGALPEPQERDMIDLVVSRVRDALGEDVFTAEWDAGRTMSWEEAVEYALTEREPRGVE